MSDAANADWNCWGNRGQAYIHVAVLCFSTNTEYIADSASVQNRASSQLISRLKLGNAACKQLSPFLQFDSKSDFFLVHNVLSPSQFVGGDQADSTILQGHLCRVGLSGYGLVYCL